MLLLLLAGGCAPHNHKAYDAITNHMRTTSQDPNSYVPISFGEPHADSLPGDTVLMNHVYQIKKKADVTAIYSNTFKVDSVSGYAKLMK